MTLRCPVQCLSGCLHEDKKYRRKICSTVLEMYNLRCLRQSQWRVPGRTEDRGASVQETSPYTPSVSTCAGGSHRSGVECQGQGQGQDLREDTRGRGIWRKRSQVGSKELGYEPQTGGVPEGEGRVSTLQGVTYHLHMNAAGKAATKLDIQEV